MVLGTDSEIFSAAHASLEHGGKGFWPDPAVALERLSGQSLELLVSRHWLTLLPSAHFCKRSILDRTRL